MRPRVGKKPPSWRGCTTSLFPRGLSPADSAPPAPLLSKLLSSLLSSPLGGGAAVAVWMEYWGRPSSALLLSPSLFQPYTTAQLKPQVYAVAA